MVVEVVKLPGDQGSLADSPDKSDGLHADE
jgi:hypothetical protein